ncbi:hypothetical protein TNCV_4930731 [Trichonephila clavipes]|nr:hypothetical protein TNCV_4930731 [Trichonephila clavipes]
MAIQGELGENFAVEPNWWPLWRPFWRHWEPYWRVRNPLAMWWNGTPEKKLSSISSVVDLSNSVIPVRIPNISERVRNIQEGEVIETCAPVTCVDWKCNTQDLSSEDLVKDLLQNTDLDEKQRCAARGLIKEFQSLYFQEHLRNFEEQD